MFQIRMFQPRSRERRPMLRVLAAVLATLLTNGVVGLVPAGAATVPTVAMKLLVISADGTETDYPAITAFLDQVGVPYDKLVATTTPFSAATLSSSTTSGNYYGIVLTTGNLTYYNATTQTWQSAFSTAQWDALHAYQAAFKVRSVTSYTFPEAAYGLSYVGYQDTLATPLASTLTTAGQAVFPYVNAANPLMIKGAWAYFGSIIDPTVTTPLLTAQANGQTFPIASVTKFADGHENLAITAANNPYLTHSLVLSSGWINWVTKGQFIGARRASIDVQVDDLFISTDLGDATTGVLTNDVYRNGPQDISALVNWQNTKRQSPNTPALKVEWAFNGEGSVAGAYPNDTLVPAVQANKAQFGFINHTFSHFNLDCGACATPTGTITTTASQIRNEINSNVSRGKALGLASDWDTMVQPDISGINTPPNAMAQKAAADAGIRYWIGDTSHAGQNNPSFNTGFYAPGDSRLYIVPRRPSNLFYPVSTPDQWVAIYNSFYGPGGSLCAVTTCFSTAQTYSQILESESDYFLRFLLQGDNDPWMFHIGNVRAYDGTHSLVSDVLDATFAKYSAVVNVPVITNSFKNVGLAQKARGVLNAAKVSATQVACTSLTLTAPSGTGVASVVVPLSGVNYKSTISKVETYAGRTISNVTLKAGQTVTIPLPAC